MHPRYTRARGGYTINVANSLKASTEHEGPNAPVVQCPQQSSKISIVNERPQ